MCALKLEEPIKSLWNKDVVVKSWGDVLLGGIKAGVSLFSQNYFDTAKEGWSVYKEFSLKTDSPGQLAWAFIVSAMMESVTGIFRESNVVSEDDEEKLRRFVNDTIYELERILTEDTFYIDQNFYDYPERFNLIDSFKPELKKYLRQIVTPHQAEALHNKLPFLFVSAVVNEWSKDPLKYKDLLLCSTTPFDAAQERALSWKRYHAWLVEQTHTSIFQEAFSLADTYIPLRAYYKEIEKKQGEKIEKRIVCNIHKEFSNWVKESDKSDNLRLISGEPGCGKSSFAKMFAAEMTTECSVLFVPLHHFESVGYLREDLISYFEENIYSPKDPLDLDGKLLLIFDGLDEYTMQGHSGKEQAIEFVKKVHAFLDRNKSRDMKVIITGREIIMQNFEFAFGEDEHVYTLLPYLVKHSDDFTDLDNLLIIDQRQEWWAKFGQVIGENYAGLPENLVSKALDDLTTRPLLNFLVARSYKSGNVQFSQDTNLNKIYLDFIESVYYRKHGQDQKSIQGLEFEDFLDILQTLALGIWQGNGRTATMKHLARRCQDNNLSDILCCFSENVEKGVLSVLTAFYSRKTSTLHQSQTFELTHKSFGEYLVARHVIQVLEKIHMQLNQPKARDKWKPQEALVYWADFFGPQSIDLDMYPFILNEIKIVGKEKAALWQQDLIKLIEEKLENEMPMELVKTYNFNDEKALIQSYSESKRHAKNAEFALLLILGMCAEVCKTASIVNWPEKTTFATWFRELVPQKTESYVGAERFLTHWLNLDNQNLSKLDMSGFILKNLNNAHLNATSLISAELIGANLKEAILIRADLADANLNEANLSEAYLIDAELIGAKLMGANLMGANLRNANLRGANLKDANLRGANLRNANLIGANLNGAILNQAYMNGAILNKVDMNGAILNKADLRGADLRGADLRGADLSETILNEAILTGVKINRSNISKIETNCIDLREFIIYND